MDNISLEKKRNEVYSSKRMRGRVLTGNINIGMT